MAWEYVIANVLINGLYMYYLVKHKINNAEIKFELLLTFDDFNMLSDYINIDDTSLSMFDTLERLKLGVDLMGGILDLKDDYKIIDKDYISNGSYDIDTRLEHFKEHIREAVINKIIDGSR